MTRRYAIVGLGSRAGMYVEALAGAHRGDGELVAFCDPNPVRMRYHQERSGLAGIGCYGPDQLLELLRVRRPDSVIVTSPDATHDRYICAALDRGVDAITEKPMTTDATRLRRITESAARSAAGLTVTFNYRYSPRNSLVRQLLRDGAIGRVTSVHFEWLLDTAHGADYFRRWHRDKATSGGLLVHKSTHHFDLVNWWLADTPVTVYATGGLRFYGAENAAARGLPARPALGRDLPVDDPFRLDLAADPRLRALYLDAEAEDGYHRDADVFAPGISIEDSLSLAVTYAGGATMAYTLTAFAPWEGYRVAFNGTAGRLELDVVERFQVRPAGVVDPTGTVAENESRERLTLQQHWQPTREIPIPHGAGAHGGGDAMLLRDVFQGAGDDPLGRAAGLRDGANSVLVGIAGNVSLAERRAVTISEL
ncbi:Gfo/Idh/MocA family protein [Dactylosporangium sp. NPDC051541]|uniref:Gfo/Idh/MocA family protein n=1 Tax=Dactylosporangium sp. NPDC051541 TaxID=3363977 RepID=UPI0037AF24CA